MENDSTLLHRLTIPVQKNCEYAIALSESGFFCRLTVCNLVSQKCTIFFTFCCFVLLRVCFGFENCLLLKPCVVSLDYKN